MALSVARNDVRKPRAPSTAASSSSSLSTLFAFAILSGRASPSSSLAVPPSLLPLRTTTRAAVTVTSVRRSRFFFGRGGRGGGGQGGGGGVSLPPPEALALAASYGRGAEIWPECNTEDVIRLEDSFPNGSLPPRAAAAAVGRRRSDDSTSFERSDDTVVVGNDDDVTDDDDGEDEDGASSPTTTDDDASAVPPPPVASSPGRKRRLVRRAVKRILRGAASSQESDAFESRSEPTASASVEASSSAEIDAIPGIVALTLLIARLIKPIDVLSATFLSGYFLVLWEWSRSPRPGGGGGGVGKEQPSLPSLPPQGHVPSLVSNPLGEPFTNSEGYRIWLKVGSMIGVLGPALAVLWYGCPSVFPGVDEGLGRVLPGLMGRAIASRRCGEAAMAAARPTFLVCCQAVCEAIGRRVMAPLPLRILIPVSFNALRLGPLWDWALLPTPLGSPGRILAIINLLYWSANLFGFLIPTATMRYLRAHFFCVEASEVTTRKGGGSAVGLLP